MRTLCVALTFAGTVASASGTIVNTEPDVPPVCEIKIRPSPRTRLVEIDTELRGLEHRTSGGQIFEQRMTTMTPWLMLSGTPLMGVGVVVGLLKLDSHDSNFLVIPAAIAAGILALAAATAGIIATLAVFDHWVSEAATLCDRRTRERELRTERQELVLRI